MGLFRSAVQRAAAAVHRHRRLLVFRAPVSTIQAAVPRLEPGSRFACAVLPLDQALEFRDAPAEVVAVLRSYLVDAPPALEVVLATIDDTVAGWFFVHVGACRWPLIETETAIDVPPSDAVMTSAYTLPAYRGRRVYPALIRACADRARERGATHVLAWCEAGNDASRKNLVRSGMSLIGSHSRRWLLGRPGTARIERVEP